MNEAQQRAYDRDRLMFPGERHELQERSGDFRLPRTRWSSMSVEEFLRFSEREPPSDELVAELRARLQERV